MSDGRVSTLDFHVRTKQRELRGVLDDARAAAIRLKEELSKQGVTPPLSKPTIDALFVQLALLDLPNATATELLPSDDLRTRGLLDDATEALKTAGWRLFRVYSDALHTLVCEKAGADLRQQVLSAISTGTGLGVITAAFVSVGVSATVAPVAAALLLSIIVRPTINEVCKMWSESLKENAL